MIDDPPPPAWTRRRSLLGPALLFVTLMAAPPVAAVALLLAALALRVTIGAVRYARMREARGEALAQAGESITIGHDGSGRPVRISERTLGAHGLILGATGAGKTTTMMALLTHQIGRGRGVVAIDLKGSSAFATDLEAAASAAGRRFVQWSPDGLAHWNPLAAGNATELKDKLLGTERFTEPHYRRAAERYLQLAIQVAQEREPQRALTLARVVELMAPEQLAATARGTSRERSAAVRRYLSSLTADQASAIRGLASRLAVISESHAGPLLEPGPADRTLDLRRALDGGEVVLFSLNSSTYGGLASMLGTLAVQDLVAASGARLQGPAGSAHPALVAIDEFSALTSDNIVGLLARGREARIGTVLATQELADLDRLGTGVRAQILGNTALKIVHRQDVPESAQSVARLAGTMRVWERSYQERSGRNGFTTSARLTERYSVEPERVRTMGVGEALVVIKSPRASAHVAHIHSARLRPRQATPPRHIPRPEPPTARNEPPSPSR